MPKPDLHTHASFATLRNRLEISGTLTASTGMRIGSGRANDVELTDLPVLRDGLGRLFIPGASLKGAFRARLEALLRAADPRPELAVDFAPLDQLSTSLEDERKRNNNKLDAQRALALITTLQPAGAALDLPQIEERTGKVRDFRRANTNLDDQQFSELIFRTSTMIDLTFGSPELAGRIFFRDAPLDLGVAFDQTELRNGVAISRDTETVEGSLLYNYEVVPAGTPFAFALTMENAADWQLGMVLRALRPWLLGDLQIGGFRSRGLGYMRLADAMATYITVGGPDDVLRLLGYGADDLGGTPAVQLPLDVLLGDTAPAKDIGDLATAREALTRWSQAFRAALVGDDLAGQEG